MQDAAQKTRDIQQIILQQARSTVLEVNTPGGHVVKVPMPYQLNEAGFRPFRAGKATNEEIAEELQRIIDLAEATGVELGILNIESLRKLASQNGLGKDCSGFVNQVLTEIYKELGLPPYSETVYFDGEEVLHWYETLDSWKPKKTNGRTRKLSRQERAELKNGPISAERVCEIFGKDLNFIYSARHLASSLSSVEIPKIDATPGDIIAFSVNGKPVSHVGIISHFRISDRIPTDIVTQGVEPDSVDLYFHFWHLLHTRGYNSGLMQHTVQSLDTGSECSGFHKYTDPNVDVTFHRPNGLVEYLGDIKEVRHRGDDAAETIIGIERAAIFAEDYRRTYGPDPHEWF